MGPPRESLANSDTKTLDSEGTWGRGGDRGNKETPFFTPNPHLLEEVVPSGLLSALLTLCGVAVLWFFGSYRRAMKRAQRAILDSQKRVLSNAEKDRARIEIELVGIEREIDGLMDPDDLASRIDSAFSDGEPVDGAESMPSDDGD